MAETSFGDDRVGQILDWLVGLDALKAVERASYTGSGRHENSAEHSWQVAVYALLLAGELAPEVDACHVVRLLLVHDVVEILAGDVPIYDTAGRADQAEREEAAASELFGRLPADLGDRLAGWWREFEARETPEARFAKAMDRLHPLTQNVLTGGRTWREHGATEAITRGLNEPFAADHPAWREVFARVLQIAARDKLWTRPPEEPNP